MPEVVDVKKQKKPTRKRVISPFSANLKKIIDERNISQKAAAEMAGVSTASINDWLNGAQPNDALAVQKLCTALKCDFEWLLTGNSSKLESKNLTLAQLFDFEDEPTFSGIFEISARRLNRKSEFSSQLLGKFVKVTTVNFRKLLKFVYRKSIHKNLGKA